MLKMCIKCGGSGPLREVAGTNGIYLVCAGGCGEKTQPPGPEKPHGVRRAE